MAEPAPTLWQRIQALPSDSTPKTIAMAVLVSAVSALVVSLAAVSLQPRIDAQIAAERQAKLDEMIASLPGLADILADASADNFESLIVDLTTGAPADIDPAGFDWQALASDPETSTELTDDQDLAGIKRRPNFAEIIVLKDGRAVSLAILPVYGSGYQSTIQAYLALQGDLNTVAGLVVTEQGETPGLGAKIAEAAWQNLWPGKQIADENGEIVFEVVRGAATTEYQVDGITGATRTSNGVQGMVRFWMGPQGYGHVLDALRAGEL